MRCQCPFHPAVFLREGGLDRARRPGPVGGCDREGGVVSSRMTREPCARFSRREGNPGISPASLKQQALCSALDLRTGHIRRRRSISSGPGTWSCFACKGVGTSQTTARSRPASRYCTLTS